MQARIADRAVEQGVAAVQALDLEPIRLRVMDSERGESWTKERAERIERAYRNYLTLLARYPEAMGSIVVSKDVDEFWHTHILHTMKYTADCHSVFGKYLHHNPQLDARTPADIEKTRQLYGGEAQQAAMCAAAVERVKPAMCAAAVEAAGMCAAAVEASKPAMCAAAVETFKPAMCAAAVETFKPAMCAAAVERVKPAMCAAAVEAAGMCAAAVEGSKPAMCAAAVEAFKPAMCAAAVEVRRPAMCAAATTA